MDCQSIRRKPSDVNLYKRNPPAEGGKLNQDLSTLRFISDDTRFVDLINGVFFGGRGIVAPEDLTEMDTKTGVWYKPVRRLLKGRKNTKYRDILKRMALGMNFVVIGIENQTHINELMPIRVMVMLSAPDSVTER